MDALALLLSDNSSGVWPWNALPWVLGVAFLALGLVEKIEKSSAYKFRPPNSHGAAKLAGNDDLKKAGLFGGKGVPIGYSPDGKRPLHYPGFGHLLTVAAARTGKGATLLVNALLSWFHSAIIIDPKCENALITAHFRRRFGKVYILNPFRMYPEQLSGMLARFNPMDILDAALQSFHADCDKLAAALVWDEGNSDGRHWTMAARMLVSGIIAALARHGLPGKITLVEVARVISSGEVFTFCRNAMQSSDPFIIQKLGRFAAPGAESVKEIEGVLSTAITQLSFIGNAAIAESLSGSDFRFADLKRKPGTTVFICLPLSKLDICDKYFRLILETALTDLLNEGAR
jgi:type IV secretion system protein VirD4